MSDQTANLALPYILPSQAQKHVTHNEALQRLDALVQLAIAGEAAAPPEDAGEGQCYLIAAGAVGDWSGKEGHLAFRQDGAWVYLQPKNGWRAFFAGPQRIKAFSDGSWHDLSLAADGSTAMIGVNTTPDASNRLAVCSDASLFSHAGSSHRIKINKATDADTGSLIFQTAWSGRAEIGLAGNDDLAIKVSNDGDTWQTALEVSPAGVVRTPARPVVRASLAAAALAPTAGSRTGFDDFHLRQGHFEFGAAVPSGVGNRLLIRQAGLYLVLLTVCTISSSGHATAVEINGATLLASIEGPASASPSRHTAHAITSLAEGDWLALLHSGAAQYEFGAGKTELSLVLL